MEVQVERSCALRMKVKGWIVIAIFKIRAARFIQSIYPFVDFLTPECLICVTPECFVDEILVKSCATPPNFFRQKLIISNNSTFSAWVDDLLKNLLWNYWLEIMGEINRFLYKVTNVILLWNFPQSQKISLPVEFEWRNHFKFLATSSNVTFRLVNYTMTKLISSSIVITY